MSLLIIKSSLIRPASIFLKSSYCCRCIHTSFNHRQVPKSLRILFYGSDEFSLESLKILKDNHNLPDGDAKKVVSRLNVISGKHEIPTRIWPVDYVPEDTYDVGVVVSFGHLIPAQAINSCKYGILNVHGSLLPKWRGASPIHHSILSGDTITGITIMKIVADKFDVGQILATQEYQMPKRATTPIVYRDLSVIGANILFDTLLNLEERLKNAKPQPSVGITKAPKAKKADGHLDWTKMTAIHVDRRSRALESLVDVYTEWVDGTPLRVYGSCDPTEIESLGIDSLIRGSEVETGSIYYHKQLKVICFKCSDGKWAAFMSVSLKGRKRMSALDFYNGFFRKILKKKNLPLIRPSDFNKSDNHEQNQT